MASIILLGISLISILFAFYKYAIYRPKGFPPGPPRIPFFGSYLFVLGINYNFVHKASIALSKIYKSDIIGMYLGDYPTVVVHNYDGIKEVFNRQEFDGRPDVFLGRVRDPNFERRGITLNDGPIWKEQRRFMLRYLRDFGFGRRSDDLERIMREELQEIIDLLKSGPTDPNSQYISEIIQKGKGLCPYLISYYVLSSLLYIFCNERIPYDERTQFIAAAKNGMKFQRNGDDYGRLFSLMPWLHKIFPNWSGYRPLRESSQYLNGFFKQLVEKYSKTFEIDQEDRNFIDMYLRQIKLAENEGILNTPFIHDQFIMGLLDFIFAAMTTIPTQISFMIQWLLLRPDVLRKIQAEIDLVVGKDRLPTLDDRKYMPYSEASIREAMRIETILPSSLLHKALVNTELMGFKIPKDTLVVAGVFAFHKNKQIWIDPDNFRPERFLDDNGQLSLKKDITLPFGAGKRLCAGETVARNLMFLMVTSICQNFDIILGENEQLPDITKKINGTIQSPPDFWVNLRERKM